MIGLLILIFLAIIFPPLWILYGIFMLLGCFGSLIATLKKKPPVPVIEDLKVCPKCGEVKEVCIEWDTNLLVCNECSINWDLQNTFEKIILGKKTN
jgi:hypothetical protein